ncbi:MAG: PASTA domain-containing protein [Ruminococcaceae bacterium]|nr:PASTA domain-containing protein [Oscillospiraceae bacterium]
MDTNNNMSADKKITKIIIITVVITVLAMIAVGAVVGLFIVTGNNAKVDETIQTEIATEATEATEPPTEKETEPKPEMVGVPDVGGLTSSAAKDLLKSSGLKADIVKTESQTVDYDYVISQSPISGSEAEKGTKVKVYVSNTQLIDSNRKLYCCASEYVTLRSNPSRSASRLNSIYSREAVEYLGDAGEFIYVEYKNQKGYVLASFFSTDPNAPLNYDSGNVSKPAVNDNTQQSTIMYCCANQYVTLRASASRSATALDKVYCRESVEYVGESGEFYRVKYGAKYGYVLKKFFSTDPNAPLNYDKS